MAQSKDDKWLHSTAGTQDNDFNLFPPQVMAQSNEHGGDELRKEVIARLRAYRHANTNDIELLTLTIDRPEAVEIDEADNLMNLVADSFLHLILADRKQHELEARIDEQMHTQADMDGNVEYWPDGETVVSQLQRTAELKAEREAL